MQNWIIPFPSLNWPRKFSWCQTCTAHLKEIMLIYTKSVCVINIYNIFILKCEVESRFYVHVNNTASTLKTQMGWMDEKIKLPAIFKTFYYLHSSDINLVLSETIKSSFICRTSWKESTDQISVFWCLFISLSFLMSEKKVLHMYKCTFANINDK